MKPCFECYCQQPNQVVGELCQAETAIGTMGNAGILRLSDEKWLGELRTGLCKWYLSWVIREHGIEKKEDCAGKDQKVGKGVVALQK